MTVIEHILDQVGIIWRNNPSAGKLTDVDTAAKEMYDKYSGAWLDRHGSLSGLPTLIAFMGLGDYCVKCLGVDKGTLVKDTRDNKYAIVTGFTVREYAVVLIGVCADGKAREIEHNQFERSEIPSEIVEVVRQNLIEKCPLLRGGCKDGEHEEEKSE